MARPGRPKTAEPREMVVSLRLTQAEYHYIQALAFRRGISIGELLRLLALADMPSND